MHVHIYKEREKDRQTYRQTGLHTPCDQIPPCSLCLLCSRAWLAGLAARLLWWLCLAVLAVLAVIACLLAAALQDVPQQNTHIDTFCSIQYLSRHIVYTVFYTRVPIHLFLRCFTLSHIFFPDTFVY